MKLDATNTKWQGEYIDFYLIIPDLDSEKASDEG